METSSTPKSSSLRWGILRQAILRKSDEQFKTGIKTISRKTTQGFNLIPYQLVDMIPSSSRTEPCRDACICYTLPVDGSPKLYLTQRVGNCADLSEFERSTRYDVDNTGLVCQWPSEEVLAYFCMSHPDLFRCKRVIELGAGYGLAGLVIAAATDATEVTISDGNPLVVDYIQRNIDTNSNAFGGTRVTSSTLHWNRELANTPPNTFDIIVASDCTFFKDFHNGLAKIIKILLSNVGPSEAIFFSPKRGDSMDKFLEEISECGLKFRITEVYDEEVWRRHQGFMVGDDSWPSYEKDHCYPFLVRITH